MDFGQQIKTVRLKLHLSQADFAQKLGVSFTTINRYENGKSNPSYRALRAFEALCKENNIKFEE